MLLFAHRGASAYAPENTLPSFRKALEMGCRGIELDVQLTSDSVPVVIHDFHLDKTTDGEGLVRDLSWKEIQKLDAGAWYAPEFKGTRIPTLEEVLETVPRDVCLNIEIKSLSWFKEDTADRVMALLAEESGRDVIISSFNHPVLKEVQEIDSTIRIGILTGSHLLNVTSYVRSSGLDPWSLHPALSYLTGEYVEEAHREGWKVLPYTVNTARSLELVRSSGADGCFSNFPDLLKEKGV